MAAARVSIPAAVRRTIQTIKEIAGGHTDDEVYAVLRECNMDPNETVQKLIQEGTFHEVKRKRDKKKESSKESADPRWRPGMPGAQGRGGKGGWANYSSRQSSNSTDLAGRNAPTGKENGADPNMEKCSSSSPVNPNTDTKTSKSISSSSGGLSNGPSQPVAPVEKNTVVIGQLLSSGSKGSSGLEGTPEEVVALGPDVSQSSIQTPPSISGACTSALDPVLPSLDVHSHGGIGATKHAFASQRAEVEYNVVSDDVSTAPDTSRPSGSSSITVPSGSRPSSSCSSRALQLSGSQKAIQNKEWKPKSSNKPTQVVNDTCDDVPVTMEKVPLSVPMPNSIRKEDTLSEVDKRPSDMRLSDKQHVIIPDHLQVSESEKCGLSFGSFGACFQQTAGDSKDPGSEKSSTSPQYESSQEDDEVVDEPAASDQGVSSTVQMADDPDLQQLPADSMDNILPQKDNSSSTPEVAESDHPKDAAASHIAQDLVQTIPYLLLPIPSAPQSQDNQIPLLETPESQAQAVQQPGDYPANYYPQLYRPIADFDGRISPFTAPGAAIKYGNMPVLPAQTGQAQEGINSLALSSSGSTPLATPAPGVVPQPQFPVFRQPVGVHVPHYQPSFIPYNQYISPFFVPPHTLHHFMGNAAFPQPPSTGGLYPSVSAAVAPPVKYSTNTYKPGANTGSQAHVGTPGAYGTYGSNPSVYTNNTVVASGASVDNDDVSGSQFKENTIYIAGQQNEGSAVWYPPSGRDLSGLQPSTFYGLPPQGQHLTFAPAPAGHGTYGGMYHPAQTLAGAAVHLQPAQTIAGPVEMAGPPTNGYQQPQRAQMNWGNY